MHALSDLGDSKVEHLVLRAVPGFLLIMWQLVYDYIYAAAVSCKLCTTRAFCARPVQRRPEDFIVSSIKV